MALGSTVNVRRVEHPSYKWLATYREGETLRKNYFKRKVDAQESKTEREETVENHGTGAGSTPAERAAIGEVGDELAEVGLTLREAIETAIERRRVLGRGCAVGEVFLYLYSVSMRAMVAKCQPAYTPTTTVQSLLV